MAITETSAQAPCPIFAGRGVEYSGFTIKTPQYGYLSCTPKYGYLSCTPNNIASERIIIGVYNYDLARASYDQSTTADRRAFGVWCETGSYVSSITDAKHLVAMSVNMKMTADYSGKGGGEQHNADVRAMNIGIETEGDLDGVAHAVYISAQAEEEATTARTLYGYYLAYTRTYGLIGLEVRTETTAVASGGGIKVGDEATAGYGVVGILVAAKWSAAMTGAYEAIAIHTPLESDTHTGTNSYTIGK